MRSQKINRMASRSRILVVYSLLFSSALAWPALRWCLNIGGTNTVRAQIMSSMWQKHQMPPRPIRFVCRRLARMPKNRRRKTRLCDLAINLCPVISVPNTKSPRNRYWRIILLAQKQHKFLYIVWNDVWILSMNSRWLKTQCSWNVWSLGVKDMHDYARGEAYCGKSIHALLNTKIPQWILYFFFQISLIQEISYYGKRTEMSIDIIIWVGWTWDIEKINTIKTHIIQLINQFDRS